MTVQDNTLQISRRFAHQEISMGAILSSDAPRQRPPDAGAVPSDMVVFRWKMDEARATQGTFGQRWYSDGTSTGADATFFITGDAGISLNKEGAGLVVAGVDNTVYRLTGGGSDNATYTTGGATVVDNSGADWPNVVSGDVLGFDRVGSQSTWSGVVQGVAGDTLTLTANPGGATLSAKDCVVIRPLFTLPSWHCQLHVRLRINEKNAVDNATMIKLNVGIGSTVFTRSPEDASKMTYQNQGGVQTWIGTDSVVRTDGWLEITWNLYADYFAKPAGVDLSNTDVPVTSIGLIMNGTDPLDVTFDEVWLTRSRPLIHTTSDGAGSPTQTDAKRAAITIMLDDAVAGPTSASDGKNSLELANLLEDRGMRGVFPVMILRIGTLFPSGIYTADWDALARLSAAGHELIIHDTTGFIGYSETQAEDRIKRLLDTWYTLAPRYGIKDYQRGARFFLSPGNQMPTDSIKIWERYFLAWMGQSSYSAFWVAGSSEHAGEDDDLTVPHHNMWPRADGSLQRTNFTSLWTTSAVDIKAMCDDAETMGGQVLFYGHRCTATPDSPYGLETITNWTLILDHIANSGYRTVTLSEFYDDILPSDATWRA